MESKWFENMLNKMAAKTGDKDTSGDIKDQLQKIAAMDDISMKADEQKDEKETPSDETKDTAKKDDTKDTEKKDDSKKTEDEKATQENMKKDDEKTAADTCNSDTSASDDTSKEDTVKTDTKDEKKTDDQSKEASWNKYAPEFVKLSTGFMKDYYTKVGNMLEQAWDKANDNDQETLEKNASEDGITKLALNVRPILTSLGIGAAGVGGGILGAKSKEDDVEEAKQVYFNAGFEQGAQAMANEYINQMNDQTYADEGAQS